VPEASLPPEAADLYGLPLEEFTPARNQLVRDLKAAKRKDEAALVAQLRRPPATAWALNKLARTSPHLVEDLVAAAASLKGAMDQAIGGDRSRLADAQGAERRAVNAGVEAAAAILTEAGNAAPDSARRKMAESLRGAPLDPAALELLRAGVLTEDVSSTGLGFDLAAAPVPRSVTGQAHPSRPALAAVPDQPASEPAAEPEPVESTAGEARNDAQAEPSPTKTVAESEGREAVESTADGVGADSPASEPSAPEAVPSAMEARADELSQRRLAKKRHELEAELTVLRQRAARLAEQVTDAEAGLVELRKRAAKAADSVAETEAELAELPPPPED
jgi:hypothetical protein